MLRNRAAALVLFLSLSPLAFGLGLGTLEQSSALNEPFDARIEILNATANDFDSLSVGLAREDQFARAGILRAAVLLELKFDVVETPSGADYIKISTNNPVREPFLNFLLELNWANGRLIREYTILLDPPLYDRNKSMAAPARRSAASAASADTGRAPAPAMPAVASRYGADGRIGPIQSGDTLWSLASAYRPDERFTVQQMMLALLRTNPEAFTDGNINMLNRGAVLRIPDYDQIASLSAGEALAEVRRQHQLWNEYRQGVAALPQQQPMGTDASGPSAPVETEAAVAAGRLELVAPGGEEGAADMPGAGSRDTGTVSRLQEEVDARAQDTVELMAKLEEAEDIIDLLQRQVDIKDDELATLQARLAELGIELGSDVAPGTPPVEPPEAIDEPVGPPEEVVSGEVEIQMPGESPDAVPPVATPEPSPPEPVAPMDALAPVSSPDGGDGIIPAHIANRVPGGAVAIFGALGAIVLLVVGVIAKAILGRRETPAFATGSDDRTLPPVTDIDEDDEPITETRDEEAVTEAPDAEEDALTVSSERDRQSTLDTLEAASEDLMSEADEDPLEEVNVYLAYERFDQAEELVKQVIADHPGDHKYKLRLLEVYYSSNNKSAYEKVARELRDTVGEANPLWVSAVAMWTEMSPDRALFEGGGEAEAAPAAGVSSKAFVDITGDTADGAEPTKTMAPAESEFEKTQARLSSTSGDGGLDFDFGDGQDDGGSDLIDLTAPSDGEDEILDLTAADDDDADMLDLTAGDDEADVLDLTVAADDADMLDLTAGDDEADMLDLTAGDDEADVLDLTAGAGGTLDVTGGDDVLDLTEGDEGEGSILDLTAAVPEQTIQEEGDLLDVTKTGDLHFGESDDLMNVTSPGLSVIDDVMELAEEPLETEASGEGILDITGADDDADAALDFDISDGTASDAADPSNAETTPVLDITSGDEGDATGADGLDFDIGDLGDSAAGDVDLDIAEAPKDGAGNDDNQFLDLELGDTGDFSAAAAAMGAEKAITLEPEEGAAEDFGLSLQSSELDELVLAEAPADDAEDEIEFDLGLQDTTDMESLVIDDTLELPQSPTDEGPLDEATDESLEDLTRSMEDAIAGLDLDDDGGLELMSDEDDDTGGGHLDTLVLDEDEVADAVPPPPAADQTVVMPRGAGIEEQSDIDETDTKLNLAKAYMELGDKDGARSILDEVVKDGTTEQQMEAQSLLDQL